VSQELDQQIILVRAILTLVGAGIGVIAGFLLLPAWDRKWLPRYLATALERNWVYFVFTFSEESSGTWTKYKRAAEVANSNGYDSFNRAVQEPGGLRREYASYYQFITHNVRITRDLNSLHLEEEGKEGSETSSDGVGNEQLLESCCNLFKEALQQTNLLTGRPQRMDLSFCPDSSFRHLNAAQQLYLSKLHSELQSLLLNIKTLTQHEAPNIAVTNNRPLALPS
jgi:uncharacterized membrane protein YccC